MFSENLTKYFNKTGWLENGEYTYVIPFVYKRMTQVAIGVPVLGRILANIVTGAGLFLKINKLGIYTTAPADIDFFTFYLNCNGIELFHQFNVLYTGRPNQVEELFDFEIFCPQNSNIILTADNTPAVAFQEMTIVFTGSLYSKNQKEYNG